MPGGEYNVMRDEIVPLLKDISDSLCNMMSAQQAFNARNDLLITLKVQSDVITKKMDEFIASQSGALAELQSKQRELEIKVVKIMTIGGVIITILSYAVRIYAH